MPADVHVLQVKETRTACKLWKGIIKDIKKPNVINLHNKADFNNRDSR